MIPVSCTMSRTSIHSSSGTLSIRGIEMGQKGKSKGSFMQQCPVAGVTNCHKVGGLKQQIFILVQFWKPKDRNQGVSRATLPPKSLRNPSLLLRASGGSEQSLCYGCMAPVSVLGPHCLLLSSACLLTASSLLRILMIVLQVHRNNPI